MISASDAKDTGEMGILIFRWGDAKAAFWDALYEKSEKYLYLGAKLFIFHEFILGENQRSIYRLMYAGIYQSIILIEKIGNSWNV